MGTDLVVTDWPSCHRAALQRKSESRFRYGTTYESFNSSPTADLSARRQTVLATSNHAATTS